MPVVSSKEATIEYPLSLTGISELEKDVLKFKRLTQRDKIEYGPKVYEPYRQIKDVEKRIKETRKDLVGNWQKAFETTLSKEDVDKIEGLDESSKDTVAKTIVFHMTRYMSEFNEVIITPRLDELQVKLDKKLVLEFFQKYLVGWSDGFYVDEFGNSLPFNKENVPKIINDLDIEKVILPSIAYLFEQCDMRVKMNGKVDFLSESTLSGSPKPQTQTTESS